MSSSTPSLKFLLDENVRAELAKFLKESGFNVKSVPKFAPDLTIATISKEESRILVTNDKDFADYSERQLFSVVLLQIPQNDPGTLVTSFEILAKSMKDFAGKLIVLKPKEWEEFPLMEEETL